MKFNKKADPTFALFIQAIYQDAVKNPHVVYLSALTLIAFDHFKQAVKFLSGHRLLTCYLSTFDDGDRFQTGNFTCELFLMNNAYHIIHIFIGLRCLFSKSWI